MRARLLFFVCFISEAAGEPIAVSLLSRLR
jgi:hypothetical protein